MSTLTKARKDVADALNEAGLKAVEYVQENIVPPVCVVLPNPSYVSAPVGQNPFKKPYSIRMDVLVIGGKGTNKSAAERIDSMLASAIEALEDDWDITEVEAPQEVSIKGITYLGALVTLEENTNIEKEAI